MPGKNQGHKIRNLKSYKKYNYSQNVFLQLTALELDISN